MRQEEIEYLKDLPINMRLLEVENYPLHWHDATEIVFVLKGSLDIEIGTDIYHVEEGMLEIVNHNEVHSLKSRSENLILMVNIDPAFFEKYYEGAREVFFYADSADKKIQEVERYLELRKYIASLFYEIVSEYEDAKEVIEERLLALMYHLLNNFHYLYYEEESLREDRLELERYHRIVSYISNNYMEKVSLQDLADQEFLTSQYLSFKIKNTFGYGFNDFLNLTRVEESIKLLLVTDKNISEISEEVGFSHVRYYNKHFRLHYGMSPMDYRKKFKLDREGLRTSRKIELRPLGEAMDYLKKYLKDYERYEYDDRIQKYDIDVERDSIEVFTYPDIISLGGGLDFLLGKKEAGFDQSLSDLGFKYGLVENLDGLLAREGEGINYYFLEKLLEEIFNMGLQPIFLLDGPASIAEDLLEYLGRYRKDLILDDLVFIEEEDLLRKRDFLFKEVDRRNDRLDRVGDIISRNLDKNQPIPRLQDEFLSSDSFYGGRGLITHNGLKKPSYYTYGLMKYLGEEVLYREEGFLVTRSEDGFEILLYDPWLDGEGRGSDRRQKKRFSLNISNISHDYRVIRYQLNRDSGSVYDKWNYLGRPRIINRTYMELLRQASLPEIKFYNIREERINNIVTSVEDRGANLYIFRKADQEDRTSTIRR